MKRSGMGMSLYVGQYNVSNDIQSIGQISTPRAVLDFTGIDKFAFERKVTLKDGALGLTAFWNPDNAHLAFGGLPTTDQLVSLHLGQSIGDDAFVLQAKQLNYDPTRGTDASLLYALSFQANSFGAEWGELLTAAPRTDAGATTPATGFDGGAGTAFGLQAYLHVSAFTGTSATISIQGSSDNGGSDAFASISGASFAAVTAPGFQRIQTARNTSIERYLRVSTTGTFSNLEFVVIHVRNQEEVNF